MNTTSFIHSCHDLSLIERVGPAVRDYRHMALDMAVSLAKARVKLSIEESAGSAAQVMDARVNLALLEIDAAKSLLASLNP